MAQFDVGLPAVISRAYEVSLVAAIAAVKGDTLVLVPIKVCAGGIVTVSEEAEMGAPIVMITEVKVDPLFVEDSSEEVDTFDFVVARDKVGPFVVVTAGIVPKKAP